MTSFDGFSRVATQARPSCALEVSQCRRYCTGRFAASNGFNEVKSFASLSALLLAPATALAAQGPGVAPGDAPWLLQLPAQAIVLMMAGFVVWGFIKKCSGGR